MIGADLARFTIVEKLGDESIGGVSLAVKPTCCAPGHEDDPRFLGLTDRLGFTGDAGTSRGSG
ncbi:MAG: hypothetical protein AB1Z65_08430 [Candidatus Sulfomarinibacteraceae bacterium]